MYERTYVCHFCIFQQVNMYLFARMNSYAYEYCSELETVFSIWHRKSKGYFDKFLATIENQSFVSDMSQEMAINAYDIVSTLQALGMMKYWKGKHIILKRQVSKN